MGHKTGNDDDAIATTTVAGGYICIQNERFFAHKAIRNTEHLRKALAKIFTFTRVSDGSCSSLCLPIIVMLAFGMSAVGRYGRVSTLSRYYYMPTSFFWELP